MYSQIYNKGSKSGTLSSILRIKTIVKSVSGKLQYQKKRFLLLVMLFLSFYHKLHNVSLFSWINTLLQDSIHSQDIKKNLHLYSLMVSSD